MIMIFLASMLLGIKGQETYTQFELQPSEHICLSEYFPENTVVISALNIGNENIKYEIKDPKKVIIFSDQNKIVYKYPFTTAESGYYEMCSYNIGKNSTFIYFDLKSGVSAKDYSSVAKTKDLQPIDLEIQKIVDKKGILSHFSNVAKLHEKAFEKSLDSMSSRVVKFSLFIIAVMIFVGILEAVYLKKFLENRKLI